MTEVALCFLDTVDAETKSKEGIGDEFKQQVLAFARALFAFVFWLSFCSRFLALEPGKQGLTSSPCPTITHSKEWIEGL